MKTLNTLLATGVLAGALTGCQTTVHSTKASTSEILSSPTLLQCTPEDMDIYAVINEKKEFTQQEHEMTDLFMEYAHLNEKYESLHEYAQKYFLEHTEESFPYLGELVAIDRSFEGISKEMVGWLQSSDVHKEGTGVFLRQSMILEAQTVLRSLEDMYHALINHTPQNMTWMTTYSFALPYIYQEQEKWKNRLQTL